MLKRSLAVMAALTLFSLAACSDDGGDDKDVKAGDPAASQSADASSESSDGSDAGESDQTSGACTYTSDGMDPAKQVDPPPADPKAKGKVAVTVETNIGDIKATLDAQKTPCTVNSFLSLADQDYFDDTDCHRLTTQGIFVLQCGDPTGTGMGGPGYQYDDELKGDETYPAGTLAMANAGPGTNGSQFFMVYKASPLPAAYTVFGKVDPAGVKLLEKVGAKGADDSNGPGDGAPKQKVTIDEVDD